MIDQQNGHLLSTKVANILPLKGSTSALIAITAFVGFILGGLSSLSGSYVRKAK
jgi:branched-subunit amino acid ABC-type transport system permease component